MSVKYIIEREVLAGARFIACGGSTPWSLTSLHPLSRREGGICRICTYPGCVTFYHMDEKMRRLYIRVSIVHDVTFAFGSKPDSTGWFGILSNNAFVQVETVSQIGRYDIQRVIRDVAVPMAARRPKWRTQE